MRQNQNHPNYDRLLANQQETQDNVKNHIAQAQPDIRSLQSNQNNLLDDQNNRIDTFLANPLQAQKDLEIAHDLALGVVATVGVAHTDGTEDLIRDARFQGQIGVDKDKAKRMSYAIDVLNEFRAAQKVLELEGKDPNAQELQDLVKERLQELFDPNKKVKKNKAFNTKLTTTLKALGVKDAKKQMEVAKHFASLDNQQYHVSTVTTQKDAQGKERAVVESNNMMLGLTKGQKQQYETIRDSNGTDELGIDWYDGLSTFDKKMVYAYAGELAKGNAMIPTQLRKHLPGLRNAYKKSTFVEQDDGFEKVLEVPHTGTPSFHGKGDRVAVTAENLEQLDTFAPPGKSITVNPLNSPEMLPGVGNRFNAIDREAPGLIRAAQALRGKGSISVASFNVLRKLTYNDNSGFDKALYEVGRGLKAENIPGTSSIASFLMDGRNEQASRNQLAQLKLQDEKFARALEHAMNAKHLIVNPHGMSDPQNSNLDLVAAMNIVSFQANQGVLGEKISNLDVDLIDTHCASGKDRTGVAETRTSHDAISDALGFDSKDLRHKQTMEDNLSAQIAGSHTQSLASWNGGTPGCHGVKNDSKAACPEGSQYRDLIERDTAGGNKFKVEETISKNAKYGIGAILLVAALVTVAAIVPVFAGLAVTPAIAGLAVPAAILGVTLGAAALTAVGTGVVYGAKKAQGYTPPTPQQEKEHLHDHGHGLEQQRQQAHEVDRVPGKEAGLKATLLQSREDPKKQTPQKQHRQQARRRSLHVEHLKKQRASVSGGRRASVSGSRRASI